jgi:hypothetical protein
LASVVQREKLKILVVSAATRWGTCDDELRDTKSKQGGGISEAM